MRIFVSEYLTSGACPSVPLDSSLMREGRLMADALLEDFESIAGIRTSTTRDSRFNADARHPLRQTIACSSPDEERAWFDRLIAEADAVLIIAPETGHLLEHRVQRILEISATVRILNCHSQTVAHCADKLTLPGRLEKLSISVVPAEPINEEIRSNLPFRFPVVLKPRFGAGCENTFCIESEDSWNRTLASLEAGPHWIVQPFISGSSLSSVSLFANDGSLKSVLPLGTQEIRRNGCQLSYQGGIVPWESAGTNEATRQHLHFYETLPDAIPGLNGYIGADWIWDEESQQLHLVEINPRLTTSYLGYRELYGTQIAASLIGLNDQLDLQTPDQFRFDVKGTVERITETVSGTLASQPQPGEIVS